jgi:hypothetical protein
MVMIFVIIIQVAADESIGLRAGVESILLDDRCEDIVKAVQDIDPVIQITSGKRP